MRVNLTLIIKPLVFLLALILALTSTGLVLQLIKRYGDIKTAPYMQEVNGMIWGTGKELLTAQVQELKAEDIEEQRLLLSILNAENHFALKKELLISWDMWGAGFLKAMQVDNDPELEIVFCTNRFHEFNLEKFSTSTAIPIGYSFYLDINSGKITAHDFKTASVKAQSLAKIRLTTAKPLSLQIILFLSMPFIVVLFYHLLMRLFAKKEEK